MVSCVLVQQPVVCLAIHQLRLLAAAGHPAHPQGHQDGATRVHRQNGGGHWSWFIVSGMHLYVAAALQAAGTTAAPATLNGVLFHGSCLVCVRRAHCLVLHMHTVPLHVHASAPHAPCILCPPMSPRPPLHLTRRPFTTATSCWWTPSVGSPSAAYMGFCRKQKKRCTRWVHQLQLEPELKTPVPDIPPHLACQLQDNPAT
jgi:hypothetical protein